MAYFKEPILFLCGIIFMKFLSDAKPCGSGCWCFKTLVDCRGTGEVPMLKFSLQRLATELDLTENPSLSLIEMDFSAWPALQALYLDSAKACLYLRKIRVKFTVFGCEEWQVKNNEEKKGDKKEEKKEKKGFDWETFITAIFIIAAVCTIAGTIAGCYKCYKDRQARLHQQLPVSASPSPPPAPPARVSPGPSRVTLSDEESDRSSSPAKPDSIPDFFMMTGEELEQYMRAQPQLRVTLKKCDKLMKRPPPTPLRRSKRLTMKQLEERREDLTWISDSRITI